MKLLESIRDPLKNLEYNARAWGDKDAWKDRDKYGYQWSRGKAQLNSDMSRLADLYLKPHLSGRYDHKILELSPGAGRFTAELIRYAAQLDLLDMNQVCLDICKERFQYYPIEIGLFKNDGRSCEILGDRTYTLIASYDSMVHMHPQIIMGYIDQLYKHLETGGIMWLDHSGKGAKNKGHRTSMTAAKMGKISAFCGMEIVEQRYRNSNDCITVLTKK